jgi:hypothetical protein
MKKILLYRDVSTGFIVQEIFRDTGLKVYATFDE